MQLTKLTNTILQVVTAHLRETLNDPSVETIIVARRVIGADEDNEPIHDVAISYNVSPDDVGALLAQLGCVLDQLARQDAGSVTVNADGMVQ